MFDKLCGDHHFSPRGNNFACTQETCGPHDHRESGHSHAAHRSGTGRGGPSNDRLQHRLQCPDHLLGHDVQPTGPARYRRLRHLAERTDHLRPGQRRRDRADGELLAKVISLPTCSSRDKPPYCFNSKLTDNTNFTQWTVSKPRKPAASVAATQAADDPTSWASLLEIEGVPATFNGVDQKALSACLDQDPDSCLQTVPGLSECVQTAQVCNAVALQAKPQAMAARTASDTPSAESLRERAAHSFAVDPQHVDLTRSSTTAVRALDAGTTPTWTVSSQQTTPGLEHDHRRYRGFTAVYSAQTGQLLEACWGEMCRS